MGNLCVPVQFPYNITQISCQENRTALRRTHTLLLTPLRFLRIISGSTMPPEIQSSDTVHGRDVRGPKKREAPPASRPDGALCPFAPQPAS